MDLYRDLKLSTAPLTRGISVNNISFFYFYRLFFRCQFQIMKSISLYFVLLALSSNFNCGEAGSAKKDTPKNNFAEIKFASEWIEVGVADGKTNVTQDFKFSNAGNVPLVIAEAKGNCHCVQAKWPEKVEPGDSAVIHVSFDPTGVTGLYQRTVMVRSNATRDSVELYITGEIKRDPKK